MTRAILEAEAVAARAWEQPSPYWIWLTPWVLSIGLAVLALKGIRDALQMSS